MRIFFVKKDRSTKAERTQKSEIMIWEEKDGMHAVPAESVFIHRQGFREPIIMYYCDIVAPVGSTEAAKTINTQVTFMDMIRQLGRKVPMSSLTFRLWSMFFRYFVFIFFIGLLAYGIMSLVFK